MRDVDAIDEFNDTGKPNPVFWAVIYQLFARPPSVKFLYRKYKDINSHSVLQ